MLDQAVGDDEYDARTTLYRGLGLPKGALKVYHDYQKSSKWFKFTGFTSTSCEEKKALEFAYPATKKQGQVPVLFVLDTDHRGGRNKAYLNHEDLSAFP